LEETESQINVELPVKKEYARLLRLMVSGVASRMNFDLDAVDDLKIAVEEAYLMAMRGKVNSPLKTSFDMMADRLQITFQGTTRSQAGTEDQKENFGNFILDAVVDEMELNQPNADFNVRMVKYL